MRSFFPLSFSSRSLVELVQSGAHAPVIYSHARARVLLVILGGPGLTDAYEIREILILRERVGCFNKISEGCLWCWGNLGTGWAAVWYL